MLTAVLDTQIILRGASSATSSFTAKIYDAGNAGRFTLLRSEPIPRRNRGRPRPTLHFPHGNEKEAVASPRIWSLGTVPPARAPVVTAATKKT